RSPVRQGRRTNATAPIGRERHERERRPLIPRRSAPILAAHPARQGAPTTRERGNTPPRPAADPRFHSPMRQPPPRGAAAHPPAPPAFATPPHSPRTACVTGSCAPFPCSPCCCSPPFRAWRRRRRGSC